MKIKSGSTNVSVYYYIVQDASGTSPGEPVTGLLFSDIETGGSASYARQGAARVDLTLITLASASATHADGGFILVDDTNMPGLYRCDYPDAAFVTGVSQTFCQIVVASANNAVAAPILVDIDDNVDQTVDNDVLAAGATGFAAIDTVVDTILVDTADMQPKVAKIPLSDGTITWNSTALGSVNAECDTAISDAALATSANLATVDTVVDAIKVTTDKFVFTVANQVDSNTLTNSDKTGYSLTQTFPTNFADLSIVASTGLVDITQTAADKSWSTTTRALTDKANFTVDVLKINGVTIIGAGTSGDLWRA